MDLTFNDSIQFSRSFSDSIKRSEGCVRRWTCFPSCEFKILYNYKTLRVFNKVRVIIQISLLIGGLIKNLIFVVLKNTKR